jgi:hypothetical protein
MILVRASKSNTACLLLLLLLLLFVNKMEHFNILLRFIRLICVNYKQANEMTQKKP